MKKRSMKELKQKDNMKQNMKNIFLEKSEKQFNQLGIPRFKKYLSLFRMWGETKKPSPYQFFPFNFYKRKNWPPKLSDFQF